MHARKTTTALILAGAVTVLAGPAAGQGMPPMPTPGPEHGLLKAEAGTWDARVEVMPGAGGGSMTSTGVETNTLGCGGLCLITDFKGELGPGEAFHGHGITTWDPARKKYVGSWTDSMSAGLATTESTYDPKGKTSSGWMEAPGPDGNRIKARTVVAYPSPSQRTMTSYATGRDGKEMVTLRITYTRRQ